VHVAERGKGAEGKGRKDRWSWLAAVTETAPASHQVKKHRKKDEKGRKGNEVKCRQWGKEKERKKTEKKKNRKIRWLK
jgi:hypothetical protein